MSTADIAPTPARQTIGLAQFFAKGSSRLPQRGARPYQVVRKLRAEDANTSAHSYRLILSGHITGYGDHRAVHCTSLHLNERPVCLLAVEFDRVAMEDAVTNEVLGDWSS